MTRHFLRSVCRVLIGAVLMAQLAISAYACPVQAAMQQPMANCEEMAGAMNAPVVPSFANLCAEHCHYGQQSDQAATLAVPATLLMVLYVTPAAAEPVVAPRPAAGATRAGGPASPPHAILHCCFRI